MIPAGVFAQNSVLETFKAVNVHYAEMETYGFEVEMTYYNENGQQIMKDRGKIIHTEKVHFMSLGGNTSLVKGKEYISVSDGQKTLFYSAFQGNINANAAEQGDIGVMLDSLWHNQDQFTYELIPSAAGTQRVIIKDNTNPYFEAVEILVDTKYDQLKEFIYHYKLSENQNTISQIRLVYLNETRRPKTNLKELKIEHYVRKNKGEMELTAAFSNYKLIDQTKILNEYE